LIRLCPESLQLILTGLQPGVEADRGWLTDLTVYMVQELQNLENEVFQLLQSKNR